MFINKPNLRETSGYHSEKNEHEFWDLALCSLVEMYSNLTITNHNCLNIPQLHTEQTYKLERHSIDSFWPQFRELLGNMGTTLSFSVLFLFIYTYQSQ